MIYNRHNFHKYTFCEFQEVTEKEMANLSMSYKSKSGSSYYFTEKGVYRKSNHWGRAANCRWRLKSNDKKVNNFEPKIGYANWVDFYPNNDKDKLFYIEINWLTNEVSFQHKNHPNYHPHWIIRDALATAKRIQVVKEVLTEENWSKHLIFDDLNELRKHIIDKLLETDESFINIKKSYL
ncbi:conserved hypothetical protein [Flavobacterium sp. 9AF]|uniref:hypothetical protein n=1 Tax=Flavobacterium sp. 9AF TaxID=2653142 RepID=UPI0012F2719F|nr:hypothetical protein [Flavobacterium sp. 9AF]VXC39666.1 conserved hypothetical protein [Flavobacterium sp. 9AF]